MEVDYVPKTLEECYQYLDKYLQDIEVFKNYPEENVMGIAHMTLGRWIRNKWYLWWSEELYNRVKDQNPSYPSTKPELVDFFNKLGIEHADDMSGIIIISYHRKLNNKAIDFEYIEKQINEVIEYYKNKYE